jgi:hypothetical protein
MNGDIPLDDYMCKTSIEYIFIFITARLKSPELCSGDEARETLREKIPRSSAAWVFYKHAPPVKAARDAPAPVPA